MPSKNTYNYRTNNSLCLYCGTLDIPSGFKTCEPCRTTRHTKQKAMRDRRLDHYNEVRRLREQGNRLRALQKYGGICACCGIDYPPYLEFDHINGGGTKERKEIKHGAFYIQLLRQPVRSDIQLLCGNCHNAKSRGIVCRSHES